AYVEVEPLKGLIVKSNIGAKLAYWGSESFTPLAYFNSVSQNSTNSFYREQNKGLIWNFDNTIAYSRNFDKHSFGLLGGVSAYSEGQTYLNTTYRNLPINTFKEASMNYSVAVADKVGGGGEAVKHSVSSMFARLNYNYSEKYLFTGIIRKDGSTRFGSNNKYGYFPSASVGWVPSLENFWPSNNVVNFLKVRGSYGVTGNDNIGDFKYLATVSGGRNYTIGQDSLRIGYSPNASANPSLRWEQTTQTNIGFEATVLRNINVTFDIYDKKTTGILQDIDIPAYVGTGKPAGNVADMENRGVELELGYHKQIGEVNFSMKGNVSYLQNRVTYLGMGKKYLDGGATVQSTAYSISRTAVGHAIGSFYGFQTLGIFQNQQEINSYTNKEGTVIQPNAAPGDFRFADLDGNGKIDANDRKFIGDPTPNWSFGVTLNAAWKGFDFLIFGQGVAGNDVYQGLRRLDIGNANWSTKAMSRWTGEGTSNSFPRLITSDPNKNFSNPSNFQLESGAYFRIKTMQIGYTIPKALVSKANLNRVRIYIGSNNLYTFTRYSGFDPEIGGSSYGIDRGYYPQARSFMAGLNVGF
ncbi:MAG TPA: SusC/RagA family TonB-linked outer membrane protein, partial [Cyclobacteriaceae bacterium]|nr:SusC/RagA family TonB-linked outer membrane protein [Cyclobacteriaceae bacterium]